MWIIIILIGTKGASGACRFCAKSTQLFVRSLRRGGRGGGACCTTKRETLPALVLGTLTWGEIGTTISGELLFNSLVSIV